MTMPIRTNMANDICKNKLTCCCVVVDSTKIVWSLFNISSFDDSIASVCGTEETGGSV